MKTFDEILEFDSVLNIIKSQLKTFSAIKLSSQVRQFSDKKALLNEYEILKELIEFIKFDGKFHFEEGKAIENSLKMSSIEGYYLTAEEIIEIKNYLSIYKSIIESFKEFKSKYQLLSNIICEDIFPFEFYKMLELTFDTDGSIKDNATPTLLKIRKRKTSLKDEIQKKCNTIFQNPDLSDSFQEKIVTFKDGRFVIPVKSAYKNKLKTVSKATIHSFSNSRETVYVEPDILFYLNEEMMDIEEEEQKEIENILSSITKKLKENLTIIEEIYSRVGEIEWLYAKASYAIKNKCSFPEISDNVLVKLVDARHPLLFDRAIPVTIELGDRYRGLIVSGPNAGGKTVLIKTVGLLIKMALCGIPIPAKENSKIGFFENIMAEIGDEQSISNNLSSFSGHILAISQIINNANSNSLVLIDEIASSTEPTEGEAIAYGVIKKLLKKGAIFIITTHYQGLKQLALTEKNIVNGAMEFDEENFKPLYKLQIGKYGKSYGLTIAQKYGLDDEIIEEAKNYLSLNQTEVDKKMIEFEKLTNEIYRKRKMIEENLSKAREIKEFYEKLKNEFENEKNRIKSEHFRELKKEYDDLLYEVSRLKNELKNKKSLDKKQIEEDLRKIGSYIEKQEKEFITKERKKLENLSIGDKVYVAKYGKDGIIEQISDDKVKVRLGILSIFIDKDELFESDKDKEVNKVKVNFDSSTPPFILDLRGMRVEEALKTLEKNIDKAIINGVNIMEILHGKGEGILRKAVNDYLKSVKEVDRFEYAKPEEGGQGKTIVFFK